MSTATKELLTFFEVFVLFIGGLATAGVVFYFVCKSIEYVRYEVFPKIGELCRKILVAVVDRINNIKRK
jgi:hypothetical protein